MGRYLRKIFMTRKSRHEFHGFSLLEFVLIREIRVRSNPWPATKPSGCIIRLCPAVTHEDATVAARRKTRSARLTNAVTLSDFFEVCPFFFMPLVQAFDADVFVPDDAFGV